MKKLVRTNLINTPSKRGTENLNIQFYSHDKNNAGFEFVIKNETDLTQYTPKVLFKFRDSNSTWQANGTIEGNIVKVNFNTDLIARCEEVLGFLFLDSDSDSLDIFKFKFNVVLSEIDKGEVANRQIKHVNNIGELELVTRSQLTEELSKLQINGVDLTDYLTTTVAEETYAKKSDLPTPYNDSDLKNRVQALENRPSTGGNVDVNDFVTKDVFENYKTYSTLVNDMNLYDYFQQPSVAKEPNKDGAIGLIFSEGRPVVFKGERDGELESVEFRQLMAALIEVLPHDYIHDSDQKTTFLTDRNFKEMVATPEFKAVVKESLRDIVKEIIKEEN